MRIFISCLSLLFLLSSCRTDRDLVIVDDNNAPPYDEIPTVVVENYVNRLFIDVIGREPTDAEMLAEVNALKSAELAESARRVLVKKLMNDTTWIAGDTSYHHAYSFQIYSLFKAEMLEGASYDEMDDLRGQIEFAYLSDSLNHDLQGLEKSRKEFRDMERVMAAGIAYREGEIGIQEMHRRMIMNAVYDRINMNNFNFIRATYNDLFKRFPTETEFYTAFDVCESELPKFLFGMNISSANKNEYASNIVQSREFHEGVVRRTFQRLIAREPLTDEVFEATQKFYNDKNFELLQENMLITDEYANFH